MAGENAKTQIGYKSGQVKQKSILLDKELFIVGCSPST